MLMVGVIGTLQFQTLLVPGGFIHISKVSLNVQESTWLVELKWYTSKEAFDNHEDDVKSDGFPRLDPIPYVSGSDPVLDAAKIVNTWFPDGKVVVE